jgi:hypothetical protein
VHVWVDVLLDVFKFVNTKKPRLMDENGPGVSRKLSHQCYAALARLRGESVPGRHVVLCF